MKWALLALLLIVALAAGVCWAVGGTPYIAYGTRYCAVGSDEQCIPPFVCGYLGLEGVQMAVLTEGSTCPPVKMIPWLWMPERDAENMDPADR